MAVADFSATELAEELLSPFSARAVAAMCLLMIDALGFETLMAVVRGRRFVGVYDCPFAMRARSTMQFGFRFPRELSHDARKYLLIGPDLSKKAHYRERRGRPHE